MSDMETYRAQLEARDAHLEKHGFSATFTAGGDLFPMYLTACRTCGAVVALTPAVEGEAHPLDLHVAWHGAHPT